jgi:hypothetical protein
MATTPAKQAADLIARYHKVMKARNRVYRRKHATPVGLLGAAEAQVLWLRIHRSADTRPVPLSKSDLRLIARITRHEQLERRTDS